MYLACGDVNIEIVFALPDRQELIALTVDSGTTVEVAIALSAIADKFPDEDIAGFQTGIWGRPVDREHPMAHGDRLELYRPLRMDPRDARRKLALSGSSMGQPVDDARDPD